MGAEHTDAQQPPRSSPPYQGFVPKNVMNVIELLYVKSAFCLRGRGTGTKRRGRDSNPRCRFIPARRFSKPLVSATHPPLRGIRQRFFAAKVGPHRPIVLRRRRRPGGHCCAPPGRRQATGLAETAPARWSSPIPTSSWPAVGGTSRVTAHKETGLRRYPGVRLRSPPT